MTKTKTKTTIVYIVNIEDDEAGDCEGAFDAAGNLLDIWSSNDANWRGEYFSGFMSKLGIETSKSAPRKLQLKEKLTKKARELWA